MIKIWSIGDTSKVKVELFKTLEGSTSAVLRVKFILFGLQLISTNADGVISIWNIKKSVVIKSYEKHEGRVWCLDIFEKDFEFLILSGDNEGLLYLWEDDSSS